jgi:hypothetical protein
LHPVWLWKTHTFVGDFFYSVIPDLHHGWTYWEVMGPLRGRA